MKKKRFVKIGISFAIVTIVLVGGFFAYKYFSGDRLEAPPIDMNSGISVVEIGEIKESITASGVAALADEFEIYAEGESNIVEEFLVEEGDNVTEGQLLVNYDVDDKKEEYENKIKELEINLKNEQMSLRSIGLPLSDTEKKELESNIAQAEKTVYDSKLKIGTYTDSMNKQQTVINTAKRSIDNAQVDIDNAKRDIDNAQIDIDNAQVDINNAQVDIDNAQVDIDNAKKNIDTAQRKVNNAQSDYQKAQKTVSDNKELLSAGAITQQEYDNSVDEANKASDTYNDAVLEYDNSVQAHEKAKQSYDKAVQAHEKTKQAYNKAVQAYDDKVQAHEKTKQAYDDAVVVFNEAQTELKTIEKNKTSDEYTLKNAQLGLNLAQAKLKNADNPMSDEETQIKYEQQQNQITLTQNSLNEYKKKLSELVYSTSSLVSGLVTEICVDEGTYTEENTVMLKIANFNKLIVQASIAEYDAPNVKLGQNVIMTTDGIEGKTYTGKVIKINPSANAETTNMGSETVVPIEISVDNPDGVLKPGYNLDLEIITVDKSDVLVVPTAALINDTENNSYYAFIVDSEQKIKKTVVNVGIYGETSTEIIDGLSEGDKVISTASAEMKDGMMIMDAMTISNGVSSKKKENDENEQGGMMFGGGMGGGPGGGMGGGPGGR